MRILLSWFRNINWQGEPFNTLRQLTDPYLSMFRGIIPALGGIDLSPMLGFFLLNFLRGVLMVRRQGKGQGVVRAQCHAAAARCLAGCAARLLVLMARAALGSQLLHPRWTLTAAPPPGSHPKPAGHGCLTAAVANARGCWPPAAAECLCTHMTRPVTPIKKHCVHVVTF